MSLELLPHVYTKTAAEPGLRLGHHGQFSSASGQFSGASDKFKLAYL